MAFRLELRFDSALQLQGHLCRYSEQGGLILPERLCPGLEVPGAVELVFVLGERRALGRGLAQRRERLGVVVELSREALGDAFALLPKDLPAPARQAPGSGVTLGRFSGTTGRIGQGAGPIQERVRPDAEAPGRDGESVAAGGGAVEAAGGAAGGAPAEPAAEEALRPATITPLGTVDELGLPAVLSARTPSWEGAEDEWAREPATEGVPAQRAADAKSSATPGR